MDPAGECELSQMLLSQMLLQEDCPASNSAWVLGRATRSSLEIGPALSNLNWRLLSCDWLGLWCCSQFMTVLRSCQQTEAETWVGSNREFSMRSFWSLPPWHVFTHMKRAEHCANCLENVTAIYSCSYFRFSPCICKYIFMPCQFSAVVTCCIWEAQLLRALEHFSLCCCLLLVKCGGTCWHSLGPKFSLSCSLFSVLFMHYFFRTQGLVRFFCLLVFFKQLICDGDSLLWTHLTSENLGPGEVSELPGYEQRLDGESK